MSITWRKDGAAIQAGIRDFGRRVVISQPTAGDGGYYECEAALRGGGVPSVVAGAFLHVLGMRDVSRRFVASQHSWGHVCLVT